MEVATMKIKTYHTALVFALVVYMPTAAHAQSSRTFYGADGRVSGRSTTDSSGATTIYDSSGRVTGRTATGSNGTTVIYGSDGRRTGTVTTTRPQGR
jgi:YD repeat-containing protein